MNHFRPAALLLASLSIALLTPSVACAADAEQAPPSAARWEARINQYVERDKNNPPPKGAIVFVGSSSIASWNTQKYFPDLVTIQRGFGGSQIIDSVWYADKIVIPYQPRVVAFYAGDNDIAAGKPPRQVLADYKAFVAKVHAALPKTRIAFIAIKPSIARWSMVEDMRYANALVEAYSKTDSRLSYVNVDEPTLGPDGRPRKELFKGDGLHLNHDGYLLWASLVRPHIEGDTPPPAPAVEWLSPRVMECWPGGEVVARVRFERQGIIGVANDAVDQGVESAVHEAGGRIVTDETSAFPGWDGSALPKDARITWVDLPTGITADDWRRVKDNKAGCKLTCAADLPAGTYALTAETTGEPAMKLTLKLRVGPALEIESDAFVPGKPATIRLRAHSDELLGVKLAVPAEAGAVSPAGLKVDWDGAEATFTAAEGIESPILLTANITPGGMQTHWLRPQHQDVPMTSGIEIDGDLGDWPAATQIAAHGLAVTADGFAPAASLGWTPQGLYLAVKVAADQPAPAEANRWWASCNVEIFVDAAGKPGQKWTQETSRQFYFIPLREDGVWRAAAGEYIRDEGKGSSVFEDPRCKTAVQASDAGWTLEAFVPAEALPAAPQASGTWRVLLSINSVEADKDSSTAGWPNFKPKDLTAGSESWGEVRFVAP